MPRDNSTTPAPTAKPLTDEQLLAISSSDSQEFADLKMEDKLRWFKLDNQRLSAQKLALEKKQKGFGLEAVITDGMLVISIPLFDTAKTSATGKSLTIASTQGNVKTPLVYQGKQVTIGLNAFISA